MSLCSFLDQARGRKLPSDHNGPKMKTTQSLLTVSGGLKHEGTCVTLIETPQVSKPDYQVSFG